MGLPRGRSRHRPVTTQVRIGYRVGRSGALPNGLEPRGALAIVPLGRRRPKTTASRRQTAEPKHDRPCPISTEKNTALAYLQLASLEACLRFHDGCGYSWLAKR